MSFKNLLRWSAALLLIVSRSAFMTGVYQHQVNAKYMRPGALFVKQALHEGVDVFTKEIMRTETAI